MEGTRGSEDERGAKLDESSPSILEPCCRSPKERRWFLLKIPRCDTNGVGETERKVGFIENTAMRH